MNRRVLLIVLLAIICYVNTLAEDNSSELKTIYGCYGFQMLPSKGDYSKYVGMKFSYLPESPVVTRLRLFPYETTNKSYEVKRMGVSKRGITIYFNTGGEESKTGIIRSKFVSSKKSLSHLPLIFMDKVNSEIENSKDKVFSRDGLKNTFRITDTKFELLNENSTHKSIVYYVQDEYTGSSYKFSNMEADHHFIERKVFNHMNMATLMNVESPSGKPVGSITKKTIGTLNDSLYFIYTDDFLTASFFIDYSQFSILIKNNSNQTMRIMWNEASFVNIDNLTSQVMHSGVKFSEREKLQVPTTIIGGAMLADVIVPINNVELIGLREMRWEKLPLFDHSEPIRNPQTIKLMIPVQVGGTLKEYIFTFRVRSEYIFPGIVRVGEEAPFIPRINGSWVPRIT